jgi:hypothetical protein
MRPGERVGIALVLGVLPAPLSRQRPALALAVAGLYEGNELLDEATMRKSGWTPERRAKQAEAIRRWQPWAKSTGPRTEEGKARSSRNADKGAAALDERLREVRLAVQAEHLRQAELLLTRLRAMDL